MPIPVPATPRFCAFAFQPTGEQRVKAALPGQPEVTPAVRVVGRAQRLLSLRHHNLVPYLDFVRGRYDEVFVIAELCGRPLSSFVSLTSMTEHSHGINGVMAQTARALAYLHSQSMVHTCLDQDSVFLAPIPELSHLVNVYVTKYGFHYMTDSSREVDFTFGNPTYYPPEILCAPLDKFAFGPKADIWSFGLLYLELALEIRLFANEHPKQRVKSVLDCVIATKGQGSLLPHLLEKLGRSQKELSTAQQEVILACLQIRYGDRPTFKQLLDKSPLKECSIVVPQNYIVHAPLDSVFDSEARFLQMEKQGFNIELSMSTADLNVLSLEQVYTIWKLTGPDVETILIRKGLIKSTAAIHTLPHLLIDEYKILGHETAVTRTIQLSPVELSLANYEERIRAIEPETYLPLLIEPPAVDISPAASFPKAIKERDVDYQVERQALFYRLVRAYPHCHATLWKEARTDIPPLYRSYVWAALLSIGGDMATEFECSDQHTVLQSDRQLDVDIPRCHQYDPLLSSPTGHAKLRRVLKAWIVNNAERYVYWQGLDSLCAPFLRLNFNNEALAYACLSAFIPKYLHNFFLKDNSAVIHEYLAIFKHLIAYHSPRLFLHLEEIDFNPELYAIPWFLTMFAHVLPLPKLYHLWDTLLLGNDAFPLCVGVAILHQLRARLLTFGFNECILLFSDLPEIDIEQCVRDAVALFCATPKSATVRVHSYMSSAQREGKTLRRRATAASFLGYEVDRQTKLGMQPLTLDELRNELTPRICASELLPLCDSRQQRGKVLILDIRTPEEYRKGTLPGALNLPFELCFGNADVFLLPNNCAAAAQLTALNGKIAVVVASAETQRAVKFAAELVKLHVSRVSVLHGGICVLRHTDKLVRPM